MQIKIGFTQNSRELQITSEKSQDEVIDQVRTFLADTNPAGTLELEGLKGARHIVLREHVAYVEVGSAPQSAVGFL